MHSANTTHFCNQWHSQPLPNRHDYIKVQSASEHDQIERKETSPDTKKTLTTTGGPSNTSQRTSNTSSEKVRHFSTGVSGSHEAPEEGAPKAQEISWLNRPTAPEVQIKGAKHHIAIHQGVECDMAYRCRLTSELQHESVCVPSTAFLSLAFGTHLDIRQLELLEVIRQGGNGCARKGEEFNIEEEYEHGGGGVMGNRISTAQTTPNIEYNSTDGEMAYIDGNL